MICNCVCTSDGGGARGDTVNVNSDDGDTAESIDGDVGRARSWF